MSTSGLLLRRGPTTDRLGFTPLKGELIFDSDQNIVYVGDGTTAGGISVFGDLIKVSDYEGRAGLDLISTNTGGFRLPIGSTSDRPPIEISEDIAYSQGMIRFNSETNQFEGYDGTTWGPLGGSVGGGLTAEDLGQIATITANEIAGLSALENAELIWQFGIDTEQWKGENVVLSVERSGVMKAIGSAVPGSGAAVNSSYSEVSYGSDALQTVDIYVPSTYNGGAGIDPAGVVMYIHGGGWQAGDKDDSYYMGIVTALVNSNHVVVNVNYRLAPAAIFPAALNDIKTVLSYLMIDDAYLNAPSAAQSSWAIARSFVSDTGLAVMGESAGGHLSVLGVLEHAVDNQVWPDAVVNFVGPMDLVTTGSSDSTNPVGTVGVGIINNFTGSNSSLIAQASPIDQLARYRAISNYSSQTTKWYFWYNRNDTLVPSTSITPFAQELTNDLGSDQVFTYAETQGTKISGTGGIPTNFHADHFVPTSIYNTRSVAFAQEVFTPTSSNVSPKMFYIFSETPEEYVDTTLDASLVAQGYTANWRTGRTYNQNFLANYNGESYVSLSTHTASTFFTDLAAGYWQRVFLKEPFNGSNNTLVTIKAKRTSGSGWVGKLYFDVTDDSTANFPTDVYGQVTTDPTEIGEYKYIQFDMTEVQQWNGTIYGIKFELGATSNDSFEIDWIAVGTDAPEQDELVEGPRGPGRFSRQIAGSTWSDTEAEDEVFEVTGTVAKFGDVVTLFNSDGSFIETRVFTDSGSGPGWETFDQFIDGSLVVSGTITADALAANTVTADKLNLGSTILTDDGNGRLTINTTALNSAIEVDQIFTETITFTESGKLSGDAIQTDGATITASPVPGKPGEFQLELGTISLDEITPPGKIDFGDGVFTFDQDFTIGNYGSNSVFKYDGTGAKAALLVAKTEVSGNGFALGVGAVGSDVAAVFANNNNVAGTDDDWPTGSGRNTSVALATKVQGIGVVMDANSNGSHPSVSARIASYESGAAYAAVFDGDVVFNGTVTVNGGISGGATTFLSLTDTPQAFGTAGQTLVVNSAGDALVFSDGGGGASDLGDLTANGFVPAHLLYVTDTNSVAGVGVVTDAATATTVVGRNSSGNIIANDFIIPSDKNLKRNIVSIDGELAVEALRNVQPKTFQYNDNERQLLGFIAQDMEQYYPELITTNDDGHKQLSYSMITSVLWKQNQELLKRIEQLEKKLGVN